VNKAGFAIFSKILEKLVPLLKAKTFFRLETRFLSSKYLDLPKIGENWNVP